MQGAPSARMDLIAQAQPDSLLRPDATSFMVEHPFVGNDPVQAFEIELGVLLEELRAMWASAELSFVPADLYRHGRRRRLLGQTGRAYDQLARLLKAFFGIGDEQILASLATKPVWLPAVVVSNRVLPADPQPDEGAAAGRANESPHFGGSPQRRRQQPCLAARLRASCFDEALATGLAAIDWAP